MIKAKSFEDSVREARRRVVSMDMTDGFVDRYLPTILMALECGLRNPALGAEFDAYVMLQDLLNKARNGEQISLLP
jgi:hypothetical protein